MIATGDTRRNPLIAEELEYAKRVQQGIIKDDSYLPILYQATDDEQERWDDEAVWKRVHPAYGKFFDASFLKREAEQAKLIPSRKAVFLAYYLNCFTQQQTTWIADSVWVKGSDPPQHNASTVYTAGLDLASVRDTNALVLYGKRADGRYDVIPFYWVAESQATQRTSADQNFGLWIKQGFIKTTTGESANQQEIYTDILEIFGRYQVKSLATDPFGARQWLAPSLADAGINVMYVPQSVRYLSTALKEIERQALNGELCHGNHPVLRYQLSCAWMKPDGNDNYFLNKSKSSDTVDGVAALADAVCVWQSELGATQRQPAVSDASSLLFFV